MQLRVLCALLILAASVPADEIVRSEKLPETTPWNLAELSEPPEFEWVDRDGPVRSLFYAGEKYGGQPTRVFAYYAVSDHIAAPDVKFPAVVLIHGGGGTAFREWAELWAKRGYAAIAMDLAGARPMEDKDQHHGENRTRLDDGGPNQTDVEKFGSIDQDVAEQWPYHAVANVIRAHSLIRSFPEVDAERTAVTGISWGGYLTCIVSGLDSRFQASVPVYGCGFLHENSAWLDRFAQMTPEQKARWVALWDPSNYLPAVSMPILFVNGTNDFAYPLDSYLRSFDVVGSQDKQFCVTVNMPHSHRDGWAPAEIGWFIDQHLLKKPALPVVGDPKIDGEQVRTSCRSELKLKSADLHYTTGMNEINMREWTTVAGEFAGDVAVTPTPPADATAWFITVKDERGAVVSSRTVFVEK
jgi:dienelactone hydrolase